MKYIQNENDEKLSRLVLKCDVLLLDDVFEIFRNGSIKNYALGPSYHLSEPALLWETMLNTTKSEP